MLFNLQQGCCQELHSLHLPWASPARLPQIIKAALHQKQILEPFRAAQLQITLSRCWFRIFKDPC